MCDKLHAVADAENRHTEIVDFAIHLRSLGCVNAGWTARENDARWLQLRNGRSLGVIGNNLGVNLALPHAAGDDLGVL